MEALEEEFFVNSQRERESYLKSAQANHVSATFVLYSNDTKKIHLKFNAYLFFNEKNHNLECEFPIKEFELKELDHCFVMGFFFLNGIKIIFESDINSWKKISETHVCLNLEIPRKMIRYQRRNAFRAKVPSNYGVKIDLDKEVPELCGLHLVNISAGGAAIYMNVDESFFEKENIFEDSYLFIPNPNHEIKVKTKICHTRKLPLDLLPQDLKKIKTTKDWYQVGIQFEQLSIKYEQMIVLLVNHLSKMEALH